MNYWDRPMAAAGLVSYRYRGRYGWIMIGATDDADALREAQRSTRDPVSRSRLQVWDGNKYVAIKKIERVMVPKGAGTKGTGGRAMGKRGVGGLGGTPAQHKHSARADIASARKALRGGANHCNGAIRAHVLATTAGVEALHAHGPGQQRLIETARGLRERAADQIRRRCGKKGGV